MPLGPTSAAWIDGQWGRVRLRRPARDRIVVPSTALILDKGAWWVLVRTGTGDRRQKVVPGPSRGWDTAILSGLHAGERVVAVNAYLEFHRDIAHAYQPPD
jgi:hypothetical protein